MPTPQLSRVVADAALGLLVGALALRTAALPDFDDRRGERGPELHGRGGPPAPEASAVDPLLLGAAAVLVLALALRRTLPRTAYLGSVAATALFLLAGGPYALVLLGPALAAHTLMTRLPQRQWLPLLAAVPLALTAGFWTHPWLGLAEPALYLAVVLGTAGMVLPGLVGLVVVGRRDAQRRDVQAERRRQAYEERLQIAREVHDVVGHSLAVINMQAGVALHVLEKRPEQLAPALEAIRSTSKTALGELSSTLATFRGEAPPTALTPAAGLPSAGGLANLDGLVGALRAAGRTVRFSRPPTEQLRLPGTVEHAALRIAQEGLTNVVRHASGDAAITLTITLTAPGLVVEVRDDGRALAGPLVEGSGIAGIRERAAAVGGTVEVGRTADGFGVRAALPLHGGGRP